MKRNDQKKVGPEVLSFSLPRELGSKLDAMSKVIGYSTRSELIRDGVRLLLKEHEKLGSISGEIEGVIILLYDHSAEMKVSDIRHRHTDLVKSYTHCDFQIKSDRCCEIMVFSGEASKVRELVNGLQSVRNVDELKVFTA